MVDKVCNITSEDFRPTRSVRRNTEFIRDYLASILEGTSTKYAFPWDYWITITMGRNPSVSEAEDILYKSAHRFDNRMLKHSDKTVMTSDARTDWILFPEIKSDRGLHYHGFIKLNMRPRIGPSYKDIKGRPSEWAWMRTAFADTFKVMDKVLTNGGKIDFRIYERSWRNKDNLKMVFYSMKELNITSTYNPFDLDPEFDRFAHTIISRIDWKPTPLHRSRTPTKVAHIPDRPNKIGPLGV